MTSASPSRVASARMRRAGWSGGVSSVRQVMSTSTGRSRSLRTRNASTSSEDASAQCASSTTSRPGAAPLVASARKLATPSRKRACAPGPSSVGVGGVPSSGTRRAVSAAAAAADRARVALAERAPHELDRAAERELGLALDTARGRCDAAAGAHARDELLGEPRLPDPCLAVEHREPPLVSDPRVRVEQRRELAVAADERMRGARRPRARVAPAPPRSCRPRERRGRRGGLLGRRDAELAMEDPDAVAVLRERRGALAARAVERDQPSVRGLVERVERETPSRMLDRAQRVAAGSAAVGEPVEDAAELPRERCGAERLPVVEDGAVAQPEAGEERAAVQRRRSLEIRELVARREAVKLLEIELPTLERDRVPRDRHPAAAERRAQRRERPAERRARAIGSRSPATEAPRASRDCGRRPRRRDTRATPSPCACPRPAGRRPRARRAARER